MAGEAGLLETCLKIISNPEAVDDSILKQALRVVGNAVADCGESQDESDRALSDERQIQIEREWLMENPREISLNSSS